MMITKREREVLDLMCHGLTAKEIGCRLGISHRTVEEHNAHVRKKTGASSTLNAVAILRLGENYRDKE